MKKIFLILVTILSSQVTFSQDFQSEFEKHFKANDTINQLKVLTEWNSKTPKDPELYTSYFNYHFMKSRQEILTLSNEEPNGEALVLSDSLDQTAGFIGSKIYFDPIEIEKGLKKIDEGIELFPDRLDMRFGKIHTLGEISDWKNFTSEIIKTIQHSAINKNNWTWTNNEKMERNDEDFLLSIQSYQLNLYNTGNEKLLENMRIIANEVLKHYPNHVPSLSNISITYLLTEEYDKAIEALIKAEKIDPKDIIVIANIAHAYKLKENKQKAIDYYQKMVNYGDEKAKEFAQQQIMELKQ